MNQDQLRAKSLALFHALVSNWSNELRGEVTGLQDQLIQKLDAIQARMSTFDENIDEERILVFANEALNMIGGATDLGGGKLKTVRRSMAALDHGTSLTEVLTLLLGELANLAPRVALFILKGGSCIGWNGRGFDQTPGFNNESIKRISVPTSANTVFSDVINSRSAFVGESNKHPDNVQLLSRIGNVLPSTIFATPLILRDRIAAVIYADSGDGPDRLQDTEALEILTAYSSKLLDALSGQKGSAKAAERPAPPAPRRPPAAPPRKAAAPSAMPVEAEEESGTAMFNAVGSASTPAAAASRGPSLDSMDPETRKKHEEAMRFARLLVSEIKLYNEAKVQQGRSSRDIYSLLRDDIDRSRQLYHERVPEPVRATTRYFNDELVRILADGDSAAMGNLPPLS